VIILNQSKGIELEEFKEMRQDAKEMNFWEFANKHKDSSVWRYATYNELVQKGTNSLSMQTANFTSEGIYIVRGLEKDVEEALKWWELLHVFAEFSEARDRIRASTQPIEKYFPIFKRILETFYKDLKYPKVLVLKSRDEIAGQILFVFKLLEAKNHCIESLMHAALKAFDQKKMTKIANIFLSDFEAYIKVLGKMKTQHDIEDGIKRGLYGG